MNTLKFRNSFPYNQRLALNMPGMTKCQPTPGGTAFDFVSTSPE